MINIADRPNCYFTHSVVADLVFILMRVFDRDNALLELSSIYSDNYIKTIKDNHRFVGEIIPSLPSCGYEMLEFLLLKQNFNDIEEYKNFILNMKDEEFFYYFYGQYIDAASLKSALQDDEGLNKLYSKYGYISTSYLALKSLFSNKKLFLEQFFSCLMSLYTEEFIKEYKNIVFQVYEELPNIEASLSKLEPLELSQGIMGKTFKNRGPYEHFIFVPSYFMYKRAVRFFNKDQILFYSPMHENLTKKDVTKILKIISDETRFEIIELLSRENSMKGKDLAERLKLSTPTISHHIEQLKEAGFINEERVKNSKFYSINSNSVDKFMDFLSTRLKNNKK